MDAPNFRAPIVISAEAVRPGALAFRHFLPLRQLLVSLPPWLSTRVSPMAAGLTRLQQMLSAQVHDAVTNPKTLEDAPHPIIYHELLKPRKDGMSAPSPVSLYEEALNLVLAGTNTTANVLMLGTFYLLEDHLLIQRLKEELGRAWPNVDSPPRLEVLEQLPFLVCA